MNAAPDAQIVETHGRWITIRCPYCGDTHTHTVERPGTAERHAPGCGLFLSPQHRLTGYWITTDRRNPR